MQNQMMIMFAAGMGVPILAALNAALGKYLGSPALAACVLFLVALACAAVVAGITNPGAIKLLPAAPKPLFLGGVLIAFYLLSITYIAPQIGLGNAIFLVLLGQLVAAALIDHFGLFGAQVAPLTAMRAAGIAVMALGVFLTQKA